MPHHILGIKWDPTQFPYAFLSIRNLDENPTKIILHPLKPDEEMNIKITDKRICVGHKIDAEKRFICSNPVSPPHEQCFKCSRLDFNRCFLLCDGTNASCANEIAFEYCKTHHSSVYLVLIANRVKVGVSFNPMKRWLNQGADIAVEIWRAPNGLIARQIEQDVSKRFNITQSVKHSAKSKNIITSTIMGREKFNQHLAGVKKYLKASNYPSVPSELQNKVVDLSSHYGKISTLNTHPVLIDLKKTKQITGTIIGVKGDFLVTKIRQSYYLYNLKQIVSHVIEFSKKPLKFKGQSTLKDFF